MESDNEHVRDGKNRQESVPLEVIRWIQQRTTLNEEISMPIFAEKFEYYLSQDAHQAFLNALNCSVVPQSLRSALRDKYNIWQRNQGDAYWASRSAMSQIDISTSKAVKEIVVGSDSIREQLISRHVETKALSTRRRLVAEELSGSTVNSTVSRKRPCDLWERDYKKQFGYSSSSVRTPPYRRGSTTPSPTITPPARPRFDDSSDDGSETITSQIYDVFQDDTPPSGASPNLAWIQERPAFTFRLQLQNDWGPKVTELYDIARTKVSFSHKNLDEISLLTGVLHVNETHIGLNSNDVAAIRRDILARFYTLELRTKDMLRAEHAVTFWSSITQKWKSLKLQHDLAKEFATSDLADFSMQPVLDMIMEAYNTCKDQAILPVHAIAQYVFRHLDDWGTLESESDAMASVVTPILQEFLRVPDQVKFKCLNASCTAGRTRKAALDQDGQARQPDVVGRTKDMREAYYGELKGPHARSISKDTDLLRLAVFTKDALDLFCNKLEQDPPILSFQSVGRCVTFFLGAKVDNTVVHARLSEIHLPSRLTELNLDQEQFYHLFQVETLVQITSRRMQRKRDKPLNQTPFPTLGTPQRDAALGIKHKVKYC